MFRYDACILDFREDWQLTGENYRNL